MYDDFIKTINDVDFIYGFIYEYAKLINNLHEYDNYNYLAIKLCKEFVMPIIIITKKEHLEEYNMHIRDNTDIFSTCSYLMNICKERFFELTQDEYLKIKKIIDNNIDVFEYAFSPIINYFDFYKKCYSHYYCSHYNYFFEHIEFREKIIKIYFNIEFIKFFYLLQKKLNKNICNINVLVDIFINLYDNSNIDCNKKINYMIYIIILFLINSIMAINNFFDKNLKVVQSEPFWKAQVEAQ